jgi:hypothetical protein
MARRGRTKNQIAMSRLEIARRAIAGEPQETIARDLGISPSFLSRELKKLREQWQAETGATITEHKAKEIAKLFAAEREAWAAWDRSKTEAVETLAERTGNGPVRADGERRRSTLRKSNRDGSWQFIETILRCIQQRCRIMGLFAAERVAHSGDPEAPPIQHQNLHGPIDLSTATVEELETLRSFRDRLEGKPSSFGVPHADGPAALPPPRPPDS